MGEKVIDRLATSNERSLERPGFKRWVAGSMAGAILTLLLGGAGPAQAQQLEPRAYSPAPVDLNIFGFAYYYTTGNTLTDPTAPVQNLHSRIDMVTPYYGRTFGFFGRQASLTAAVPVADAEVTGDVFDRGKSIDRTGLCDPIVRFAMNLIGGPAMKAEEFFKRAPETTLGMSVVVNVPVGQYDKEKLINLGTNRWAVKPELGLSHPVGNWSFEVYAGVWLFEANDEYFGGKVRRQDPLQSYQAHIVYELRQHLWLALDYTYFVGGETSLNGVDQHDRTDNSRAGATISFPVGKGQSLKATWARGVSTRVGSDFETLGAAWQVTWF